MKATLRLIHLPDTRGVQFSRYGLGNNKLGASVYTYSRKAGAANTSFSNLGTCPGATDECESICYAKRIDGPVKQIYVMNSDDDVPAIPTDCRLLRIHVSGDFDTSFYVQHWISRLLDRPDVTAWAYTRSWRVPTLVPDLEQLRALPNVQLFASMDPSTKELPPAGWRRAWLDRAWDSLNAMKWGVETRLTPFYTPGKDVLISEHNQVTFDGGTSYVCPEETGRRATCEACRYCFDGKQNDVTFLEHEGGPL